jgi:putative Holliday junction resolvase
MTLGAMPPAGRLLGIDYGAKRIGVAVTDPERRLASPLENYTRRGEGADLAWLRKLVAEERVAGFVVGLPVFASGDESPSSVEARRYGAWLHEATGLPVAFFDERYTSALADEYLGGARLTKAQKKARRDMLAAQILLSAFLESKSAGQPPGSL